MSINYNSDKKYRESVLPISFFFILFFLLCLLFNDCIFAGTQEGWFNWFNRRIGASKAYNVIEMLRDCGEEKQTNSCSNIMGMPAGKVVTPRDAKIMAGLLGKIVQEKHSTVELRQIIASAGEKQVSDLKSQNVDIFKTILEKLENDGHFNKREYKGAYTVLKKTVDFQVETWSGIEDDITEIKQICCSKGNIDSEYQKRMSKLFDKIEKLVSNKKLSKENKKSLLSKISSMEFDGTRCGCEAEGQQQPSNECLRAIRIPTPPNELFAAIPPGTFFLEARSRKTLVPQKLLADNLASEEPLSMEGNCPKDQASLSQSQDQDHKIEIQYPGNASELKTSLAQIPKVWERIPPGGGINCEQIFTFTGIQPESVLDCQIMRGEGKRKDFISVFVFKKAQQGDKAEAEGTTKKFTRGERIGCVIVKDTMLQCATPEGVAKLDVTKKELVVGMRDDLDKTKLISSIPNKKGVVGPKNYGQVKSCQGDGVTTIYQELYDGGSLERLVEKVGCELHLMNRVPLNKEECPALVQVRGADTFMFDSYDYDPITKTVVKQVTGLGQEGMMTNDALLSLFSEYHISFTNQMSPTLDKSTCKKLFENGIHIKPKHLIPVSPTKIHDAISIAMEQISSMHAGGLVHLDIKPDNILQKKTGNPSIADFGTVLKVDQQGHLLVGCYFHLLSHKPTILELNTVKKCEQCPAISSIGDQLYLYAMKDNELSETILNNEIKQKIFQLKPLPFQNGKDFLPENLCTEIDPLLVPNYVQTDLVLGTPGFIAPEAQKLREMQIDFEQFCYLNGKEVAREIWKNSGCEKRKKELLDKIQKTDLRKADTYSNAMTIANFRGSLGIRPEFLVGKGCEIHFRQAPPESIKDCPALVMQQDGKWYAYNYDFMKRITSYPLVYPSASNVRPEQLQRRGDNDVVRLDNNFCDLIAINGGATIPTNMEGKCSAKYDATDANEFNAIESLIYRMCRADPSKRIDMNAAIEEFKRIQIVPIPDEEYDKFAEEAVVRQKYIRDETSKKDLEKRKIEEEERKKREEEKRKSEEKNGPSPEGSEENPDAWMDV
ncbi:MAG: hypothetical protein HQK53_12310 [Oligoflexia bacterium]|nr:hypothetical protein [Oligoflexia bacterium]